MSGWVGNPFADPKDLENEKIQKAAKGEKKPTTVQLLGSYRWVTNEEAELHYISSILGQIEKDGFKFYYGGPWSEWPLTYTQSVIAHHFSLMVLRNEQYEESKGKRVKSQMPQMSAAEQQKGMLRQKDWFSRQFPETVKK